MQFRIVGRAAAILVLLAGAPVSAQSSRDAGAVEPSQTSATYGDWELRCRQMPEPASGDPAPELCELIQIINVTQQSGQVERLAQIAIGRLPGADSYKIVLQTPQNVALRKGVQILLDPVEGIQDDPDKRISATYLSCFAAICLADTDMEENSLAAIAASEQAQLVIGDRSGRDILVPFSLNGFSAALSALAAKQGQ